MFSHHPEVIDYPPICHHYIHRAWNLINWKKKKKKKKEKKKHDHKSFLLLYIFESLWPWLLFNVCVCVCVCVGGTWFVHPPSIPWRGVPALDRWVGGGEGHYHDGGGESGGVKKKMRAQEFPSRTVISPQSLQQHTLFTATHAAGSKNRIGPSPHPSSPLLTHHLPELTHVNNSADRQRSAS